MSTWAWGISCRQERREVDNARLLELAESQDAITRRDAMSLLNLSEAAAYERLRQLTVQGRLVRVGRKYYPAGQVVPPDRQYDVIRVFLEQCGSAYRQDLAALLHIGNRQCALILRHMVEDGRLVRVGQQYYLPRAGGGFISGERVGLSAAPSFSPKLTNSGYVTAGKQTSPSKWYPVFQLS